LTVRAARATDVPAMHAIRLAVRENRLGSPDRVTQSDYRTRLLRGDGAWVAERNGAIVGFAMVDPPSRSIWALFVSPQAERSGVGRALQATMLDAVFEAWPLVALSTSPGTRAESFYRASGWDAAGTLANGERVFRMTRERWHARRG
jgi:ribosomal protein S18 acetylase RimI-like enzyme